MRQPHQTFAENIGLSFTTCVEPHLVWWANNKLTAKAYSRIFSMFVQQGVPWDAGKRTTCSTEQTLQLHCYFSLTLTLPKMKQNVGAQLWSTVSFAFKWSPQVLLWMNRPRLESNNYIWEFRISVKHIALRLTKYTRDFSCKPEHKATWAVNANDWFPRRQLVSNTWFPIRVSFHSRS